MNRNRKSSALAALWAHCVLALGVLSSCDVSDTRDELASVSTTTFSVSIIYSDTVYSFTYNGDSIIFDYAGRNSLPKEILRKNMAGTLRAYRGDELEMDTVVHLKPVDKLSFIQFPGEKIKFYDAGAGETESEPANAACSKIRFTYTADFSEADSLRLIWMSSKKANLTLPGAKADALDTLMLYRKGLSRYVEFDTERYRAEDSNTYFFYTRQTWNGSAWTGNTKTAAFSISNGGYILSRYKFATCQFRGPIDIIPLFGTEW